MTQPIIRLSHVGMEREDRTVLHDIDFTVDRGDFIAITGPNGGGKTTLLRIMLRLLRPTGGKVIYYDSEGSETSRLSIGYLPQKNAIDSHFPITVGEVVGQGLLASKGIDRDERRRRIDETLALVGLEDFASRGLGRLSGGQMQRALLGRALISRPELLVLDEPLSYLDKHFEECVYKIIADAAREATIVLVSHEVSTIAAMANRHLIIDRSLHVCHSRSHFVHYDCE